MWQALHGGIISVLQTQFSSGFFFFFFFFFEKFESFRTAKVSHIFQQKNISVFGH